MEAPERFRHGLVRLLRQGKPEELLGCRAGQCGVVEIRLEYRYVIALTRRTIVVHEREVERLRQKTNGRWQTVPANVHDRGRLVLDRRTGAVLASSPRGRRRVRNNLHINKYNIDKITVPC